MCAKGEAKLNFQDFLCTQLIYRWIDFTVSILNIRKFALCGKKMRGGGVVGIKNWQNFLAVVFDITYFQLRFMTDVVVAFQINRNSPRRHKFRYKRALRIHTNVAYIHADIHIYWKNLCREPRVSNNMPLPYIQRVLKIIRNPEITFVSHQHRRCESG